MSGNGKPSGSCGAKTGSRNKVVAVASGKGGVGKTVCAANLAMQTAARRVTLAVDLDIGCGNLNTCLGVKFPSRSIGDFMSSRAASLLDVRLDTGVKQLQLISCSYRPSRSISLTQVQKQQILEELRYGDSEFTFVDLGAGVHADILDFFSAADVKVLVTTPESLSMHNAFVFLKSLIYRTLFRELEREQALQAIQKKLSEVLYSNGELPVTQIVDRMRAWDRYSAYIVQGLIQELKIHVLFNMMLRETEKKFVTNFYNLVKKHLGLDVMLFGLVPYDKSLKESVQSLVPFAMQYPQAPAARAFRDLSLKLENCLVASQ